MLKSVAVFLLACAIMLFAGAVNAQEASVCFEERAEVVFSLAETYDETPAFRAITKKGSVLEVFKTADGLTWTILVTTPDGTICLTSAGVAWEAVPPPEPDLGPPA